MKWQIIIYLLFIYDQCTSLSSLTLILINTMLRQEELGTLANQWNTCSQFAMLLLMFIVNKYSSLNSLANTTCNVLWITQGGKKHNTNRLRWDYTKLLWRSILHLRMAVDIQGFCRIQEERVIHLETGN